MQGVINYPHVASMAFNTPLYATPELIASVKSVLIPRLTGKHLDQELVSTSTPSEPLMMGGDAGSAQPMSKGGNIAVINIHGVLVSRRGVIDQACTELISYELLRSQITAALNHESVEEIVLDFHSGGGMAMGCKELADFIHAATEQKPITAIINFAAYSAAYFLASACSKIICSPTAGVGSIGVILETFEVSKWEEEVGITYNTFYRGSHKNDMSVHEEITEQAKAEIDRKLDKAYAIFTQSVASYRGLDLKAVVGTEARLYDPEEALSLGLVDEIKPAQEAVNEIAASYAQQEKQTSIGLRAAAINIESQL